MNNHIAPSQTDLSAELNLDALRDLLDSELLMIGGGDVIQFGG